MKTDFFKQLTEEQQKAILAKFPKHQQSKNLIRRTEKRTGEITYVSIFGQKAADFNGGKNSTFVFEDTAGIESEKQFLAAMVLKEAQQPPALVNDAELDKMELALKKEKEANEALRKKLEAIEAKNSANAEKRAKAKAEKEAKEATDGE